jgi:hypothetical protein
MSQADSDFARGELERILIGDDELTSLCHKHVKSFWPIEQSAGILVRDQIMASLRDKKPLSLLRVGNGEGNALSMTKNTLHPLQISTFYAEFLSQNGIPIPQDAAIKFCAEVRTALITADIVGFRSFRFDERSMIRESIDQGDAYAALGFLYARELLQDGLRDGYWRRSIVTPAVGSCMMKCVRARAHGWKPSSRFRFKASNHCRSISHTLPRLFRSCGSG